MNKAFALVIIGVALFAADYVNAMTFRSADNGGQCDGCAWIAAEGEITATTASEFLTFWEQNPGGPVYLNSGGGSLIGGLELGQVFRRLGLTTYVGKTVPIPDLVNDYEVVPGECASSCAYAFMGGRIRGITSGWYSENKSALGVHQFYSASEESMPSSTVQEMVGSLLLYVVSMGIDPRVIVAANATQSAEIYWFSREELIEYQLDNSASSADPWTIEPYKSGAVISTVFRMSERRSVAITFFCRKKDGVLRLLTTEDVSAFLSYNPKYEVDPFFSFTGDHRNQPSITVSGQTFLLTKANLESERLSEGQLVVSWKLGTDLYRFAGQSLKLDPDLPRVMGGLFRFEVDLPPESWLRLAANNCI